MANSNVAELKSQIMSILGAAAADLGVTFTQAAPVYLEQLARLSAAYAEAKVAGHDLVAAELALALEAQAKGIGSIVADEATTALQRAWTAIVQVLVKTAIVAMKAA